MPCAEHLWWFDGPCPKCTPAPVTAPVTEPDDGPGYQYDFGDDDDIPPFLQRNPDNTLRQPQRFDTVSAPISEMPQRAQHVGRDLRQWSDEQLHRANNDETISVVDRQPILRELHRRHDRKKSLDRIQKMKEGKTAKHAE